MMPDEILHLLHYEVFVFLFEAFQQDEKNIVASVSMSALELQTGDTVSLIGLSDFVFHDEGWFPYTFLHELSHYLTANLITDGKLHNSTFQNYLTYLIGEYNRLTGSCIQNDFQQLPEDERPLWLK